MRMNSEFSVLLTTGVIFAFTQHTLSYRAQLPLHGFSSFADYFQLFCLGWFFFRLFSCGKSVKQRCRNKKGKWMCVGFIELLSWDHKIPFKMMS